MELIIAGLVILILMLGLFLISLAKKLKKLSKLNNTLHTKYTEQTEEYYNQRLQLDELFKDINSVSENNARVCKEYAALMNKYHYDIADIRQQHRLALDKLQSTYDKELSARKSSEVRVGQISEQLMPFLEGWPYDPKNFRFCGSPLDGLSFEEDKILFVEIKTGKSKLSKKQENIKKLVKEGKVEFVTVRIDEKGVQIA